MQLKTLLEDVDYQLVQGNVEQEISALIYDSRKAAPGKVFVAMKEGRGCGRGRDSDPCGGYKTGTGTDLGSVFRTSGKRADNDRYHRHQGKDNSDLYGTFHS